jgi:hypothetical protein
VRDGRLKRLLEVVRDGATAQGVRDADPAADDRKNREHDQRHRHRPRRLVRLEGAVVMLFVLLLVVEVLGRVVRAVRVCVVRAAVCADVVRVVCDLLAGRVVRAVAF